MADADFVHLHNHTMYSLLDGALKIPQMLKAAGEMHMRALAITDHGNLFGAIEFYTQAKRHRIKPVIGIETYVAPESRHQKKPLPGVPDSGYHLILLAKNLQGYRNLIKLSTAAYLEGFYFKPRIDKELLAKHAEGLIALSGCLKGEVAKAALAGDENRLDEVIRSYLDIFGTQDFYLEIQDHGLPEEAAVRAVLRRAAAKYGLGLVATNDCHYLKREHYAAHDVLLCIQTGKLLSDTDRLRYNTDQLYFNSPEKMKELFADMPEAVANTVKIADRCNLEIELGKNLVPRYPLPANFSTADDYLAYLARAGLAQRYHRVTAGLEERLNYELDVIKQMGYSGYFLIVKDFIDFAKSNGISVGPGRGSAAGSLVSYSLGITDIDPIKYNLIFERFLNPERVSMPDIDIDFADRGRDKVIEYVMRKYGRENVAQIITFGTMAARAVVRDVGRVMSVPYGEMDKVAKLIPEEPGMTLQRALELSADLRRVRDSDPTMAKVLEYAEVLEGLARHASTHAAGVVIAPGPLTDHVPLYRSSRDEITTQYDMHCVEMIGLLKMDFLGLRTLTVIEDAVAEVWRNRGVKLDLDRIPLDDKRVFDLFASGRTVGIFQFESAGMREYLRRLQPTCIDDLIAMNALYRPGPLDSGTIGVYIECKRGQKKTQYEHPLLEPILKDTYGVIVYQEQVLKIAQEMAGYSLGKADILRKAMGKKQPDVMAAQKSEFIEGAVKRGIDRAVAERVFDQIETFGRYGFVKAHATGYALIAYKTAYLKTYYPREFLAASLTSEMDDSSRVLLLKRECAEMGIKLVPPDVNKSFAQFTVSGDDIVFGLAGVKNVGLQAAEAMVAARQAGPFTDIFDFCCRVDTRLVNKKALESLAFCGAFDSIHPIRSQVCESIDLALNYSAQMQKDQKTGQSSLFHQEAAAVGLMKPKLKDVPPWSDAEKREREKRVLGFYLSSHPLEDNLAEYRAWVDTTLDSLEGRQDGARVLVGGVVQSVKVNISRNNKQYAVMVLEDFSDTAEVLVFPPVLENRRQELSEGNKVLVLGTISTRENEKPKIRASEVVSISLAHKELPCALQLFLNENILSDEVIDRLHRLLRLHPGTTEVLLRFEDNGTQLISRVTDIMIEPSPQLLSQLHELLGGERLHMRLMTRSTRLP